MAVLLSVLTAILEQIEAMQEWKRADKSSLKEPQTIPYIPHVLSTSGWLYALPEV